MGESRHNPTALMAKMMPPRPLAQMLVGIKGDFAPKEHVLVFSADRIRETDGRTEVLVARSDTGALEWALPPEGSKVVMLGQQLEMADMDFVVWLMSGCAHPGITDASGRPPMTELPIGEIARVDALTLSRMHEAAFGPKSPMVVSS